MRGVEWALFSNQLRVHWTHLQEDQVYEFVRQAPLYGGLLDEFVKHMAKGVDGEQAAEPHRHGV